MKKLKDVAMTRTLNFFIYLFWVTQVQFISHQKQIIKVEDKVDEFFFKNVNLCDDFGQILDENTDGRRRDVSWLLKTLLTRSISNDT